MGWREALAAVFQRCYDEWKDGKSEGISVGAAVMELSPASRLALARELLKGTDYGLIYRSPPRKCPCCGDASGFVHGFGDNDIPLLTCKACGAVGPEHSNDGWNAARVAMLGEEP